MAVRFARGGGGCMAFLGRSPRAVMGALLVIAALLVVAAMHRRPPPAAALGPRCAPAVGRGGPVNHSVPVIYRTRAQYCADISARPSASGAFSRVPIEGPPAYWFVPPVPDFLDMNAAARGGWGNDLPQFYSIFSDVFRDSPADAVMIDVGANIGLTSLRVAALGRTVLAVEPVPSNLRALALSVCANDFEGRFTLVAAAAGATDSTTRIYVPKGRADNTALSECVSTANVGGTADAIDVAVVSLDSLLRTIAPAAAVREALIARVHLFKIDVQGFEPAVMQGASGMLAALPRKAWVVAEHDAKLLSGSLPAGASPTLDIEFMTAHGYTAHKEWKGPVWDEDEWLGATDLSLDVWYTKA